MLKGNSLEDRQPARDLISGLDDEISKLRNVGNQLVELKKKEIE